jgi:hypothetical protein
MIHVRAQFAARNAPAKRLVCFLTAWLQRKRSRKAAMTSRSLWPAAENRRDNAPAPAAKDLDELAHLLAHIRVHGAGIREVKFPGRAAGEGIRDESSLVGPPAVNRCLPNIGVSRHIFDGQIWKAIVYLTVSMRCAGWQHGPVHCADAPEAACCLPPPPFVMSGDFWRMPYPTI